MPATNQRSTPHKTRYRKTKPKPKSTMGREFTMKGKSKKGNFSSYQPQYASSASADTLSSKATKGYIGPMPTRGAGMGGTRPPRPKQGARRSGEIG